MAVKSKRGGMRPGAGRKPGVARAKSRGIIHDQYAAGVTPIEVMLGTMRKLWAEANGSVYDHDKAALAASIAKDAAPYMHPRLSNIEANVNVSNHESALDELDGGVIDAAEAGIIAGMVH